MIDENRLRDELDEATIWVEPLSASDADAAAAMMIEMVVDCLRADLNMPRRSRDDWELYLADTRNAMADELTDLIAGHVSYRQMVVAIVEHFIAQGIDGTEIAIPSDSDGGKAKPSGETA